MRVNPPFSSATSDDCEAISFKGVVCYSHIALSSDCTLPKNKTYGDSTFDRFDDAFPNDPNEVYITSS